MRRFGLILSLLCVTAWGQAETSRKTAPIDLRKITITDLQGKKVRPLESKESRATVLVFVMPDCPIANAYTPELNALYTQYAPSKVAFAVVYVGTDSPLKTLQKHAKEFGYKFPVLLDRSHKLAKALKAKMSPEAFLIAPEGKPLYQGRVDDRYVDFGKKRHEPTVRDLRNALDAVLAGKKVAVAKTRAVGCFIPDP
jgi:peroxiredoxin